MYYAYATGNTAAAVNIQTARSRDLVHWTAGKDAMPNLASWAGGATWAPEVLHRPHGTYVMYYAAQSVALGVHCVGYASSKSPNGHFVDRAKKPFLCQPSQGGSIDPDVFQDAHRRLYLLWKNDGNAIGKTTYIYVQRLSPDGQHLQGQPKRIEHNDRPWEGSVTEAPTMWEHAGRYYLFYSANAYDTSKYAVGYASCRGPMGPCHDAPNNPILKTRCDAVGPGHQALIVDHRGTTWIVYHAWEPHHVGYSGTGPGRLLWIDRVLWRNGKPVIHGPTCTKQPDPSP
jgi:beta-xylosidase